MKSVGFSWGVRQNIQQTNPFSLRSSNIDTNQPTAATTLYWKPPQWFDLVGKGQLERQRQSIAGKGNLRESKGESCITFSDLQKRAT